MTIYMWLLEEKVLHLWRGRPEELWQKQPLIRQQIFRHSYKSHIREFQCSVQFEYFALLRCSTLYGPFSAHLCQHQERWALERCPRLADPSGRGTEACPPGPPLHMSIIRHRVDLDFQASRGKKGKEPCKCLKLMCQSITDKLLQKQGTAPMEEDLKIQGESTTSLKLCSVC